jgi:hypothetical protein
MLVLTEPASETSYIFSFFILPIGSMQIEMGQHESGSLSVTFRPWLLGGSVGLTIRGHIPFHVT